MHEVSRFSEGMSSRAMDFLRENATEFDCAWDTGEDRLEAEEIAGHYGLAVEVILGKLSALRNRFGGLQYRSPSWSFEEVIRFAPALDFGEDDPAPMAILIEHTVAHPFGVWATLDEEVYYRFPGEVAGDYVKVFDRCEGIIESDAMRWECLNWTAISSGGAEEIANIETAAGTLSLVSEASGATERWWQGEDFRVHVWRTWAEVFGRENLARWAVWGSGLSGIDQAKRFLEQAMHSK